MTETPTSDARRDDPVRAESILEAVEIAFGPEAKGYAAKGEPRVDLTSLRPGEPSARTTTRSIGPRARDSVGAGRGLASPSAEERRNALEGILAGGITPDSVGPVAHLLLTDPDARLRLMAARALAGMRPPPRFELIRRGLLDPDDAVRAAVVGLVIRSGAEAIASIVPLVGERAWPLAQQAAVRQLSGFVRETGRLAEPDHDGLLAAVASLDPPPLPSERRALDELARAIGSDRLIADLRRSDVSRLGAARLLVAEASPAALQAVAALQDEDDELVRAVAQRAAAELEAHPEAEGASSLRGPGAATVMLEPESDEIILVLAGALDDPSEAVREQARAGLETLRREEAIGLAERALRDVDEDRAAAAATIVRVLRLTECAGALLHQASAGFGTERAVFLRALASLSLGAEELASLASAQDAVHRPKAIRLVWETAGRTILPFLVAFLEDTSGAVRMAVLEVFSESGDPSAATLAYGLLQNDSSAAVRATAVHVLARSGGDARLPGLALALADADPDVRATAVETLPFGAIIPGIGHDEGAQSSAHALARALRDEDERVSRAAASRLARFSDKEAPVVWTALRESEGPSREEVIRQIERRDPARLAALALANASSLQAADRVLAVELAVRAATPEATAAVVSALGDPDPSVRRIAAAAMSSLRSPMAVDALSRSLSDPRADIRVEAVRALGLIDDDSVPTRLITALKDPEVRVREGAVEALVRWRSPAVARRLADALSSPDLRRPAGDVLVRMGAVAVEPLTDLVMRSDLEVRAAGGALLERVAGPGPFLGDLGSTNPDTRFRAVEVLGAMGGRVAVEALMQALSDPEVRVRSRAATVLGSLGDPRSLPALKRMFLSDPVVEVAVAAEAALHALGSPPETERPSDQGIDG